MQRFCLLFENLGHKTCHFLGRFFLGALFASLLGKERTEASTCTINYSENIGFEFPGNVVFFSITGGIEIDVCVVTYPCDLRMDCFSLSSH